MRKVFVVNERVSGDRSFSVSYSYEDPSEVTLNVKVWRDFSDLSYSPADFDGMIFPSMEAATSFAEDHGYIREYFSSPDHRARHLAKADFWREMAMS